MAIFPLKKMSKGCKQIVLAALWNQETVLGSVFRTRTLDWSV